MAHPIFGPELRSLIQDGPDEELKEFCEALHPATVAETLVDELDVEETWRVLRLTKVQTRADIFEYFPLERQVEMVDGAGQQEMARLIEEMSPDDRADLLIRLDKAVADPLLRLVDKADRQDIAKLVQYQEETAGALMTTEYAWVPDDINGAQALERMRLQAPETETIYYVYVLNNQRKLLGVLSLRDVIMMKPE